jgi:hypothetical protein
VSPDGVLYIGDVGNYRIRRVALDGTISTIAGNGATDSSKLDPSLPAVQTTIHQATGLAVDGAGNVYAVLFPSRTVVRITSSGSLEVVAGGGSAEADGVPATQAYWSESWGIAIDQHDGTLYIATSSKVRAVTGVGLGG